MKEITRAKIKKIAMIMLIVITISILILSLLSDIHLYAFSIHLNQVH